MKLSPDQSNNRVSFAHREVVAPVGLWERGAEVSTSARLLTPKPGSLPLRNAQAQEKHRAPKAFATSPSGETYLSTRSPLVGEILDIHASNVSPLPQLAVSVATVSAQNLDKQDKGTGKKRRHSLRRASGKILPYERVAKCGQKAIGSQVTLHSHDGHSHFGGIETCSSVWACPVCAAKITEGRKVDVEAVLKAHSEAGGTAFMATLTVPHHRFQSAEELRKAVSQGWRKVKSGKSWLKAREQYRWLGDIRAMEITHGDNGWHPHLHVLILFKPGATETSFYGFGDWLYRAWSNAISRLGMGSCSRGAFTFEKADYQKGAAEYVSKWGAAMELTKGHIKKGRGGRTPWQILGDFSETGKSRDRELFREYALAFKGARQLTWSRGLRARYLSAPEVADDELATEPQIQETHMATMGRALFDVIVTKRITAHVLTAQETSGLNGVLKVLTKYGIPWRLSETPGLERDCYVPLISLGLSQGSPPPIDKQGKHETQIDEVLK